MEAHAEQTDEHNEKQGDVADKDRDTVKVYVVGVAYYADGQSRHRRGTELHETMKLEPKVDRPYTSRNRCDQLVLFPNGDDAEYDQESSSGKGQVPKEEFGGDPGLTVVSGRSVQSENAKYYGQESGYTRNRVNLPKETDKTIKPECKCVSVRTTIVQR